MKSSQQITALLDLTESEYVAIVACLRESISSLSPTPELRGAALIASIPAGDLEMVDPELVAGYCKVEEAA